MKKAKLIIFILVLGILLTGCTKSSAAKFKKEYESLNGKTAQSGKTIREVSIPDDNPIVYQTADEIVSRMENGETFVVYFGFASCPWCRSMVEQLIKSAKDNNVSTIYYVDIYKIRDKYEVDDSDKLTRTEEGTDGYNELINLLGDVLDDYTLTTESGEKVEVNEKRIYAPNVVAVVNGSAIEMVDGISSDLKDPYDKLTEDMKNASYSSFKCLWECLSKESTMCSKNSC